MIKPYGSDKLIPLFEYDDAKRKQLEIEAQSLKKILVSSAAAANAVMLGGGYFTPLTGFMNKQDLISVSSDMQTKDSLFWPVPIVNMVKDPQGIKKGERIALLDPNVGGNPPVAIQTVDAVEMISDDELKKSAKEVFGTDDMNHPGVSAYLSAGNHIISGKIVTLNFSYFEKEFAGTFKTAVEIRDEIKKRSWNKVVAFQTRNPMHRAHEELCRMAHDQLKTDGILIHMLLGKLKEGDIPADVRDKSIKVMVENYFPPNTVMITGYGFDMLYAGPKEALLHAIFRQNAGCTDFIIGRDHAGVGSYYGPFDAQTIFDNPLVKKSLSINIFRADHTAWSKKLNKVVMMRDVPDHTKEDFILLSGTKVREMLSNKEAPPPEFTRFEVAKILIDYYSNQ